MAKVFLGYSGTGLYSPSSFVDSKSRGQGLAVMLCSWILDSGMTLVNTVSQSPLSHGLWKRLSRDYHLVAFSGKEVLTGAKAMKVMDVPEYGLALLGKGHSASQLKNLM